MSKKGFISDIHGNSDALRAVLEDVREEGDITIYCLGDLGSYGADLPGCLGLLEENGVKYIVKGNHDEALYIALKNGLISIEYGNRRDDFIDEAALSIDHALRSLHKTGKEKGFMRMYEKAKFFQAIKHELPDGSPILIAAAHGTFHKPSEFYYLYREDETSLIMNMAELMSESEFKRRYHLGIVGHTHQPFAFPISMENDDNNNILLPVIKDEIPRIVNIGSVGQPRDGIALASYGVLDGDMFEIRRVEYDIRAAQFKVWNSDIDERIKPNLVKRLETADGEGH